MNESVGIVGELIATCDARGIRLLLSGDGNLTVDAPPASLTPDLIDKLKAHNSELLTLLRPMPNDVPVIDPTNATEIWQAALDQLEGDPLFPPELMTALRAAKTRWGEADPREYYWP